MYLYPQSANLAISKLWMQDGFCLLARHGAEQTHQRGEQIDCGNVEYFLLVGPQIVPCYAARHEISVWQIPRPQALGSIQYAKPVWSGRKWSAG